MVITEPKQSQVVGTISRMIFESKDNFFKILVVDIKEVNFEWSLPTITVTGSFPEIEAQREYVFYGALVEHGRYGLQLQVQGYEESLPKTKDGLIAYLSSDEFPGIGRKTAQKVVTVLGEQAIQKIRQDYQVLAQVDISPAQAQALTEGLNKLDDSFSEILLYLNGLGVSTRMVEKIYNHYHTESLSVVKDDPYRLVRDIKGFGFKSADDLAYAQGIQETDPVRLRGGLLQTLFETCHTSGDTYLMAEELLDKGAELLATTMPHEKMYPKLAQELAQMQEAGDVVLTEDQKVYLKTYYISEKEIALNLQEQVRRLQDTDFPSQEEITDLVADFEAEQGLAYGDEQKQAIYQALTSPIFLLTGGPGTGKTTIINGIVHCYQKLHPQAELALAAPTGRAAKRMAETTGYKASTIHRLLGLGLTSNQRQDLEEEEQNLVTEPFLIIDESSMIDTHLMRTLTSNLGEKTQLLFVGDKDQLPSVGPGQVFADLLASDIFPKVELRQIYRQKEESTIPVLAQAIQAGKLPENFTQTQVDRSFLANSAGLIPVRLKKVIERALQSQLKADDIQVLAPMYRSEAGIDNLNHELQEIINPRQSSGQGQLKKEVEINNFILRIGDRVLQKVNQPEKGVYNGDIGKVVGIELAEDYQTAKQITVDFDQNEVEYKPNEFSELTLAYCLSIHKAQGSEFPVVILVMVDEFSRMLNRNLLYTGITRAKNKLVMMGQLSAYQRSVSTTTGQRKTGLIAKLQQIFNGELALTTGQKQVQKVVVTPIQEGVDPVVELQAEEYYLTPALAMSEQIDPMIGMEGLTPENC